MNFFCEEIRPLTLTAWNLSDKYDGNHPRAFPDMPNMSCKRSRRMLWSNVSNAPHKSSRVKTDTCASLALPGRQFMTSMRSVSVPRCARSTDWQLSQRLFANKPLMVAKPMQHGLLQQFGETLLGLTQV